MDYWKGIQALRWQALGRFRTFTMGDKVRGSNSIFVGYDQSCTLVAVWYVAFGNQKASLLLFGCVGATLISILLLRLVLTTSITSPNQA